MATSAAAANSINRDIVTLPGRSSAEAITGGGSARRCWLRRFGRGIWPPLNGGLAHAADVDHRTGVVLEALAQFDDLRLVGQKVAIVVHHFVGEDRFVAGRRRDVAPGGPSAGRG